VGLPGEKRVPPLAHGDRLARGEFLRRWKTEPKLKNAELIGGLVYLPGRASAAHGDVAGNAGAWLGSYSTATPGTASGHNTPAFLLNDTPQPDVNLRILPDYWGGSWAEDGYLRGVPEMLVEICPSSPSYNLHVKRDLYHAAKVPEYLAILLFEQEIRWHVLVNRQYQLLQADRDGLWRSRVFPGLWLDGEALLARDLQRVLARLQEGLQSAEHQRFVAELANRKATLPRQ